MEVSNRFDPKYTCRWTQLALRCRIHPLWEDALVNDQEYRRDIERRQSQSLFHLITLLHVRKLGTFRIVTHLHSERRRDCVWYVVWSHTRILLTWCLAFVVAWGGMSAQSARLVGLLILLVHLKRLGITRWERISFTIWLVVGLGASCEQVW